MSLAQKVFFLFPYYSTHKNHHQNPQFSIAHIEKFLPARIDHPLNLICDRLCFFDRLYNSPAASKKHSDIVILPSHWVLKYYSIELRSEEHTSELQSRENLVCRLLLEKKKKRRDEDYL